MNMAVHMAIMLSNVMSLQNQSLNRKRKIFLGLEVDLFECHRVLGSVVGSDKSCNNFMKKVTEQFQHALETEIESA